MQSKQAGNWRAALEAGVSMLKQGAPQQALANLEQAVSQAPDERDVRYWLGNAYRMNGRHDSAREVFESLLAANPGDFEVSFALAFLLRDTGAHGEAATVLIKAATEPALTVQQLLQIAGFLRDSNQFDAAIQVCEQAAELSPGDAALHFKLARLYQGRGKFERALESLRRTLDLDPTTGPAWLALAQQKRFSSTDDPEYLRLRDAATRSLGREADMCIAFAHGKALDDLKQYREAWVQYRKGNQLMAAASAWNPDGWSNFVNRSIERTARRPSAVSDAGGQHAVFIVGMPRSGTTLLEQILDRHPQITARGEMNLLAELAVQSATSGPLSAPQRRKMGDSLWAIMRQGGSSEAHYIDKNPLNFRHLDVLFELLPSARVLHMTRDGRASCLSCYFQLFQHKDTAFTYRLENLAAFYEGYRRLMAHWETLYADRILRVAYDGLVSDSMATLVEVLDFLDVPWHDSVARPVEANSVVRTASVWQARQATHTGSIERWRNYYGEAPDFFDRLAAVDRDYDAAAPTKQAPGSGPG